MICSDKKLDANPVCLTNMQVRTGDATTTLPAKPDAVAPEEISAAAVRARVAIVEWFMTNFISVRGARVRGRTSPATSIPHGASESLSERRKLRPELGRGSDFPVALRMSAER